MDSLTPLLLLFLAAVGIAWFDGVRARERATAASKLACEQCQVQFLDQTVRLGGMSLKRSAKGNLGLCRSFRFEFSEGGADRRPGTVIVQSGTARQVILEGTSTGTLNGTLVIPLTHS